MDEPNYITKLRKMYAEGKLQPTGMYQAVVAHDDWCAMYDGRPCDCDPDIQVCEGPRP
ncbi:MAG: hypothetical protein AAB654_21480 [Acidobacteriota bacterium]